MYLLFNKKYKFFKKLHKLICQDWKNNKKYERIKLLKIPE